MIQDIEPKHLYNEWKKNAVPKKSSAVVQFRGRDLLCRIDDNGLKFPARSQFPEPDEAFTYLFELDGREYCLLFDEEERTLDGYSYRDIVLFRTEKAEALTKAFESASIGVRHFGSAPRLENCLRVSMGTREENVTWLKVLKDFMGGQS